MRIMTAVSSSGYITIIFPSASKTSNFNTAIVTVWIKTPKLLHFGIFCLWDESPVCCRCHQVMSLMFISVFPSYFFPWSFFIWWFWATKLLWKQNTILHQAYTNLWFDHSGKTVPWVIKSRQSKTDLWNYKSNQKKLINQCEKNAKEVCTYFFNFWKKTAFRRLFSSVNPLREKSERIYGLHAGAAEEMRQTKFIICINIYKALPVYPLT